MQIVLMASGTRGDVQPMIALGKALKTNGHQVRLIAGSNFTEWIESHGLGSYPTVDIEKLMQSEMGRKWVESPNQREQLKALKIMTNTLIEKTVNDTIEGTRGADLLIGGFLAQPYLQAISEKQGMPMITAALQPFRPTSSGAASILPVLPNRTSIFNRWMGLLGERLTWSIVEQTTNVLRERLGLSPHTAWHYSQATRQIPALYAFSPHVVPHAPDTNAYTTGYWFLDEPFTPSRALADFISQGEAPIYFGFGSMPDGDPSQTQEMIADALQRVDRRGIVASGWSDLSSKQTHERIFVLQNAPHSWLFPQMAAVVHHGGAGTTAAGLRAGNPCLILPQIGDQPYWARRLYELGVSLKPLSRHKLSMESLVSRLDTLVNDTSTQTRATEVGSFIRAENGVHNAVHWIDKFLEEQ
ncbi:MAG: glycosyltransferase [Anaerolineae bacterium]|nr:glycosyltransferase [Anaerolineae bacterium]